ncbi:MAG: AIPR family protein, partial [Chthoniobacteraceae bacterium]
PMAEEALRASDEVQKNIEDFFKNAGFHYDRRKNSWRKSKHPRTEVIGISELAQSYGSIVLKEPDTARARPGSFFKKSKYDKVFGSKTPLKSYLFCAKLRKRMEAFLSAKEPVPRNRTNLLFYCLSCVALMLDKGSKSISELDADSILEQTLEEALQIVNPIYAANGGDDHAARGTKMIEDLRAKFNGGSDAINSQQQPA